MGDVGESKVHMYTGKHGRDQVGRSIDFFFYYIDEFNGSKIQNYSKSAPKNHRYATAT